MSHNDSAGEELLDILWLSLRGGNYDLDQLKEQVRLDSLFDKLGIDSLDLIDFFMRIEERHQIKIRQEDYPALDSLQRVQEYLVRSVAAPQPPA